jgi:hypothetical protein
MLEINGKQFTSSRKTNSDAKKKQNVLQQLMR